MSSTTVMRGREEMKIRALIGGALLLGLSGLGGPVFSNADSRNADPRNGVDISGGGSKGLAPAACLTSGSTGVSIGEILSCAMPEPQQGAAGGLPFGLGSEEFERVPGVDYTGVHGAEPEPLPIPAGCNTPVHGAWTQGHGVLDKISRIGDRTVYEVTLNWRWDSGIGEGGRSTTRVDVSFEPQGYAVVVGREYFEGTIGGRTGSMVLWDFGHVYPSGHYVGRTYAIGGTEGLANIRIEGGGVGVFGKSGHWTQPSRVCFAD